MDIPGQTWDGLADLLISSDDQTFRRRFAELLNKEVEGFRSGGIKWFIIEIRSVIPVEIVIQSLRIDVSDHRRRLNAVLSQILSEKFLHGSVSRRWFLLLIRYAREKGNIQLVQKLFMAKRRNWHIIIITVSIERDWREILDVPQDQTLETVDIEKISKDLTYREAMDLRWAIEVAREAQRQPGAGSATPPATA